MGKKQTEHKGDGGNTIVRENPAGREGGFPTWGDFIVMIAIFLAGSLVAGLCLIILRNVAPGMEAEPKSAIVYTVQFLPAIVGIWFYRRSRGARKSVFHFNVKWYNASLVLLGLVLMLAVSVVMEPILELFPERYFETLNNAIGSGGWAILMAVLLAPLFEEMLFRGLILESAKQRWGASAAILFSALMFGLVHAPIWPQVVNAFVMGIMLGYVYVLTDSLLSVIIIHAANNALAFLFLEITGTQETDLKAMIGNDTVYWLVFAGCLVVFIVSLVSMAVIATDKRRKRSEIAAVFSTGAVTENEDAEPEESNNNE